MAHDQFYATAAQVIPTIMVVAVLELRHLSLRDRSRRTRLVVLGFFLLAPFVGEAMCLNVLCGISDDTLGGRIVVLLAVVIQLSLVGFFATDGIERAMKHVADPDAPIPASSSSTAPGQTFTTRPEPDRSVCG